MACGGALPVGMGLFFMERFPRTFNIYELGSISRNRQNRPKGAIFGGPFGGPRGFKSGFWAFSRLHPPLLFPPSKIPNLHSESKSDTLAMVYLPLAGTQKHTLKLPPSTAPTGRSNRGQNLSAASEGLQVGIPLSLDIPTPMESEI